MIRTHLRSNVVGYVALFVALSASAYAAGLAPNSVRSKHIKNGHVKGADLAADAVTGPKVADLSLDGSDLASNSVTGPKVADLSLTGGDLAANSVGGPQIAESTLGEVPRATIAGHGGYGRQSADGTFPDLGPFCDPKDALFKTGTSVAMTPSAPGRVLVTGRYTADSGEDGAYGDCRLGSSTGGGIPGTQIRTFLDEFDNETVTIVGITGVFQPGNYSFGLDCREIGGDISMRDTRVTAVVISPF